MARRAFKVNIDFSASDIKPPCTKDCKNRSWKCHSECVAYADYRKKVDERKKMVRLEAIKDYPNGQ